MTYAAPLLVAVLTLFAAAASTLALPAEPDAAVAAVFPPWWDRAEAAAAVADAGGLIVREGAVGSILVVRPEEPGLPDRLRANGAVLVVNPLAARGCLGPA